MKRLIALFAVAGLLFAPLASARDFGRGGGWGAGHEGGRAGYGGRPGGFERPAQAPPSRSYGPRGFGGAIAPAPAYRANGGAYRTYPGGGPMRWRRGERLAPEMRGPIISDYAYYHLRRPPPGYYWRRNGDAFLLMAEGSGMIFEVISAEGY